MARRAGTASWSWARPYTLGLLFAALCLLLSKSTYALTSYRIDAVVRKLSGPLPGPGTNKWTQCVSLSLTNPLDFAGSVEGTVKIAGGSLSRVLSGSLFPLSGDGVFGVSKDWIPARGEVKELVEFCVDYETTYSLVTDVRVAPDEDKVAVQRQRQTSPVKRLNKRDGFVKDWLVPGFLVSNLVSRVVHVSNYGCLLGQAVNADACLTGLQGLLSLSRQRLCDRPIKSHWFRTSHLLLLRHQQPPKSHQPSNPSRQPESRRPEAQQPEPEPEHQQPPRLPPSPPNSPRSLPAISGTRRLWRATNPCSPGSRHQSPPL